MSKKQAMVAQDEGLAELMAALPVANQSRKEAESEGRIDDYYLLQLDSISTPTFIVDVLKDNQFSLAAINKAHESISGLSRADVINKPLEEWLPDAVARNIAENYAKCVMAGKPYSYEEMLNLSTGEIYWRTVLSPQFGPNGNVVRIFGQANDITAEKQSYLQELEKFSNLREMLTDFQDTFLTAAHDLRSPLCQLDSLLKLLQMRLEKSGLDGETELLTLSEKLIDSSISHLDEVLGKIQHTQVHKTVMSCFGMGRVCSEISLMLDPLEKARIQYATPHIIADRTLVHTALFNLVDNALKHNRDKDDLLVDISVEKVGEEMIAFTVTDNGKGMDRQKWKENAKPGYSEPGMKPHGFGLYTIRRMISAHGGSFDLDSPGKGLQARFTLPGRYPGEEECGAACEFKCEQLAKRLVEAEQN